MEILNRTSVLSTPWLTIFKETIRANNGETFDYYITEPYDSIQILAYPIKDQIILTREYRYGCKETLWQLPSGNVNPGESVEETARRELAEETGYIGGEFELLGWMWTNPSRSSSKNHFCSIQNCTFSCQPDTEITEDIIIHLVDFDTAVDMVLNGEICSPHPALAILLYSMKGK